MINYLAREIRKDMALYTWETVQFPRNLCNAMLGMYLYVLQIIVLNLSFQTVTYFVIGFECMALFAKL